MRGSVRRRRFGAESIYDLVALAGVGATNEDAERMHAWLIAYVDPGAGSLIVQATIATVVAVPFYLRRQIAGAVRRVIRTDVRPASVERRVDR